MPEKPLATSASSYSLLKIPEPQFSTSPAGRQERTEYADTIEFLLGEGLNINFQDFEGNTALHLAAQFGHLEILEILLEKGANLAICNQDGKTALQLAVEYDRRKMTARQRAYDDGVSRASLFLSTKSIKSSVFKLNTLDFFSQVNKNRIERSSSVESYVFRSGFLFLIVTSLKAVRLGIAMERGDIQQIKKLATNLRTDVSLDRFGTSPLKCAIPLDNKKIAKLFLKRDADFVVGSNGKTALMYAVLGGYSESAKGIIEACQSFHVGDIDAEDGDANTALHHAVNVGKLETIIALCRARSLLIIKKNFCGDTPLMIAARKRNSIEIVVILLDHLSFQKGLMGLVYDDAFEAANMAKCKENARVIKDAWTNFRAAAYIKALQFGNISELQKLIQAGFDIHKIDEHGENALYSAIREKKLNIVRWLLEQNVEIYLLNNKGCTPLTLAIKDQNIRIVEILVERHRIYRSRNFLHQVLSPFISSNPKEELARNQFREEVDRYPQMLLGHTDNVISD